MIKNSEYYGYMRSMNSIIPNFFAKDVFLRSLEFQQAVPQVRHLAGEI